jgi:phage tail-like protein
MTDARADAPRRPFGNMRFRVEIDGIAGSGAIAVTLPEARIVTTPRKTPTVAYGALIVKRGLTVSRDWYAWWDSARRAERPPRKSVRIVLLDDTGVEAGGWLFEDAAPVAYHISPLDALGNAPVIETLELAVGHFEAAGGPSNRRSARPRRQGE